MKAIILFSLLFIVACASARKYEQKISTWVGTPSDELVKSWGPPASVFKLTNGDSVFQYNHQGDTSYYQVGYSIVSSTNSCQTEFTVNPLGVITDYNFRGNGCRSN